MSDFKNAFIAAMLGLGTFPSSSMAAFCPDLAPVLAIDSSGSINDRDFALQRSGYAAALAGDIAGLPRRVTGNTGIGRGLWTALDLLEEGRACAARQVINVSGDGRESFGPHPRHHVGLTLARDRAEAMGVTVNGLAITLQDADLSEWYRKRVIAGQDAFVMTANSFEAFGDAIVRKLVREIAVPMLAQAGTGQERLQ